MAIDVNNESGWDIDEEAVLDAARYALHRMRIHPLSELSVIAVDAAAMEQLHLQWMNLPNAIRSPLPADPPSDSS